MDVEKRGDGLQVTHIIWGWSLAHKPSVLILALLPPLQADVEEMSGLEEPAGWPGEHSYIYILDSGDRS
jgi:hypothetical protein